MVWFVASFALVFILFWVTTILGRSLLLLFRVNEFNSPTLRNLALSSFVGTAVLSLAAGWLSKFGLPMRVVAPVLGLGILVICRWSWSRDKKVLLHRQADRSR